MHNSESYDHRPYVPTSAEMEERYRSSDRVWSGNPNATLVDCTAGLTLGAALDIGCGEGADALWLENQGWQVPGIDFAPTAVARTRERGAEAQVATFSSFSHTPFDLVSVH